MPTYYVDPTATGADTGVDAANAWTGLQRAVDGTDGTKPVAGDTVLCKASSGVDEILTTAIDISALNGTSTDKVKFVAVNSSWVVDWVNRYTLDGNQVAPNCLYGYIDTDYTSWESFHFYNALDDGVSFSSTSGAYGNMFINCEASYNTGAGWNGYRNSAGNHQFCISHHNTGRGYENITGKMFFCTAYLNGNAGFETPYATTSIMYGCVAYLNTTNGFNNLSGNCPVINCVSHANGNDGMALYNDGVLIIGSRITGHDAVGSFGIDFSAERSYLLGNYFQGNDTNFTNVLNNDYAIENMGVDTNQYDQGDTDYGYVNSAIADFNLALDATMRDISITLPEE